ncbi:ISL3 family transposase [Thermodesulfobacteriota bacterium]
MTQDQLMKELNLDIASFGSKKERRRSTMSTSLLYHAFNIKGYRYRSTEYCGNEIIFRIEQDSSTLRCPCCESRDVIRHGAKYRKLRAPGIAFKHIFIAFAVPRVECRACGVNRQVKIGFADENKRHIRQFERCVLGLSSHMTIQGVALHLGVSWDVVKDIQKRNLEKKFSKPRLKDLESIAIDEIYTGKIGRFITLVLDLATGAVVFVGDGKAADALIRFWRRLKSSGAKIKAVAMDMSKAYISAVTQHLPNSRIVFDHFHVVKLFNDKLTKLRRDLYREAKELLHKNVLKGTRWLLLKNPENLVEDKNERQRLDEALNLNEPLATAYYLKEDLRALWSQPNTVTAQRYLSDWISLAEASGIKILTDFASTMRKYRQGILAYFDYPISTGPLEGTNNKIKTMQRQAYGFRDKRFFTLKIYALHLTKYALVG